MRLSITKAFALGFFKAPLGSSNMGNFKFGQHIRITVTLDLKFLCSTGTKIFKRAKSVILACSQYLCRTSLLCKLRPALLFQRTFTIKLSYHTRTNMKVRTSIIIAFSVQKQEANLRQAVANDPSDKFIRKQLKKKSFYLVSVTLIIEVMRTATSTSAITFKEPFTNMPSRTRAKRVMGPFFKVFGAHFYPHVNYSANHFPILIFLQDDKTLRYFFQPFRPLLIL